MTRGNRFTVAIDGPAASGKGTIARAVAAHFGFAFLDTGLLYRAVAARLGDTGVSDEEAAVGVARALAESDLERADLRSAAVAEAASRVAAIPAVREALADWQRGFARRSGGAVLDGRDIGTVICPEAEVKLFVTASAAERARRRHAELRDAGSHESYQEVLAAVRARDSRDAERAAAPLRPAEDALLLDTTDLSIDAAVAEAVTKIEKIMEGRG